MIEETLEKNTFSKDLFLLCIEIANFGIWDWNLETDKVWWSPNMYELFDFPKDSGSDTVINLMDQMKPEYIDHVTKAIEKVTTEGGKYNELYQLKNGKWVNAVGQVFDVNGVNHFIGACMDVTKMKQTESDLAASMIALKKQVTMQKKQLTSWDRRSNELAKDIEDILSNERED